MARVVTLTEGHNLRQLFASIYHNTTKAGILIALIGLVGCHKHTDFSTGPKLPYKVHDASDSVMIKMQARFAREGVKVITEGQDYMLSIQSASLFPNQSPQLTWASYKTLNLVAKYLKQFRKITINVNAFSEKGSNEARNIALTKARARAVGGYLWSQGIDSRFVFTQGFGSDKPIVSVSQGGDLSENSRVEITFIDAVG